jgi:hypothetical protein
VIHRCLFFALFFAVYHTAFMSFALPLLPLLMKEVFPGKRRLGYAQLRSTTPCGPISREGEIAHGTRRRVGGGGGGGRWLVEGKIISSSYFPGFRQQQKVPSLRNHVEQIPRACSCKLVEPTCTLIRLRHRHGQTD